MACGALHCNVAVDAATGVGVSEVGLAGVSGMVAGAVVVPGFADVPVGDADVLLLSLPPPPQPASNRIRDATASAARV